MPHENRLGEVVEAAGEVADAIEGGDSSVPPPGDKPPSKWAKLRQVSHLITSVVALLAAVGAFLKTCDHSVTENSYNTLSETIKSLNEGQQKNHDDIVALHGYLDGLTHASLAQTPVASAVPADSGAPAPSASQAVTPPVVHPAPTGTISAIPKRDSGAITFEIVQAPPLPSVHAAAPPAMPPPFAQAAAAK